MDIVPYLKLMVQKNGSDLFFSTGAPPNLKAEGDCRPIGSTPLQPGQVRKLAYSVMSDDQIHEFEATLECNMAISISKLGRFRVNVFRQRGDVAMVIRYIKGVIPPVEQLNLPVILKDLILQKHGLILVVGATGSGKSTTLAAMLEHRNQNMYGHILTIEDPIEYLYTHKRSIVDQREVGIDTLSYENALKNAMREAPDVIQIGEIRDMETMKYAHRLRRDWPPLPLHPALQQRQSGPRPDHQLLSRHRPAAALHGPLTQPQGGDLTTPGAQRQRPAPAGSSRSCYSPATSLS